MIVRISKRENPFVQIDKRCLSDSRLSWRARGILAYLLSKPNDWTVSVKDIESGGKEGRDAVQAALKELASIGYATMELARSGGGKLAGKTWVIHEEPTNGFSVSRQASEGLKNRPTVFPTVGKSAPTNNDKGNNIERRESEHAPAQTEPSPLKADAQKSSPGRPAGGAPGWEDRPNTNTPDKMRADLQAFYENHSEDWKNLLSNAGAKYEKEQCREIVTAFCAYQIENNRTANTYRQTHAALQRWFIGQKAMRQSAASKSTITQAGRDVEHYRKPQAF